MIKNHSINSGRARGKINQTTVRQEPNITTNSANRYIIKKGVNQQQTQPRAQNYG